MALILVLEILIVKWRLYCCDGIYIWIMMGNSLIGHYIFWFHVKVGSKTFGPLLKNPELIQLWTGYLWGLFN